MKLTATFEARARKAEVEPKAKVDGVSPAARNLALAHHIERLIEGGLIQDYTQAAQLLGVSQPRMSHLMGLRLLAPVIQEAILMGRISPKEKQLRELTRKAEWREQVAMVG